MKLSIADLSKYMGVTPKTIERWFKQGKLPVFPSGGEYQFHKDALEKWARKRHIRLNLPIISEKQPIDEDKPGLSKAIRNSGIFFNVESGDLADVFNACIGKVSDIPEDFKEDLIDRLLEREAAHSTGVGNGIAIPHPREPLAYLKDPLVYVFFLKETMDFNALDNQGVSVLFFILAPSLTVHLHLLSSLSFCLRDNDFRKLLITEPDAERILEMIDVLQDKNPL